MDAMVTKHRAETAEAAVLPVGRDDLWTLAAFGVLAYMISNVLHEGLGHGGVAWLSGARQITVTSTYMEAGLDTRWILAAGTLANLAFGLLGHGWPTRHARREAADAAFRLVAHFVQPAAGHGLFSFFRHRRHWRLGGVDEGFIAHVGMARGLALLGAVSYFVSAWVLARELARIVGPGGAQMRRVTEARMRRMTSIIYFAGELTACLAGVRNPMGWRLMLISAAASSLGGCFGADVDSEHCGSRLAGCPRETRRKRC